MRRAHELLYPSRLPPKAAPPTRAPASTQDQAIDKVVLAVVQAAFAVGGLAVCRYYFLGHSGG
jgi:hypothetical protein